MNDIMNLEAAILAADPDDMFEETNYLELFLEKESANENRRARRATAKVQKKRLKEIAIAEGMEISNPVEIGKNRNHATYSHLDFNSDGSYALNRILNKESKGEIAGWKCPSKRSKTTNMEVIAAEALDELHQDIADEAIITAEAIERDRELERAAIIADINNMADETLAKMRNEWEETAVSIATMFMKLKAVL